MWITKVTMGVYKQNDTKCGIVRTGETTEYYGPYESVHDANRVAGDWDRGGYGTSVIKLRED